MKSMTFILIFAAGALFGAYGTTLFFKEKSPEIGLQNAQGCIMDGTIHHADGSVTNNWVCFDPNE